ncbi:PilW family protein [uncultured Cocleimonas sp.]|uniref:PilW family protein n=1 Tax=uncultured Cocleimonas sp. TaxID=1051587 RepID=UPI002601DEB7|nr:PilW family protein [uncultured Cocleimonas sp.]
MLNKNQAGLSLIELLVAMIIGLFLLAGISSSFLSSKKSSIQRDQFSLLEDNGRIALEIMSSVIEHTGYTSGNGAPLLNNFMRGAVNSRICSDGQDSVVDTGIFTTSPNPTSDDDIKGDRIGVVYLGDDQVSTDCTGGPLPVGCQVSPTTTPETASIYNAFYLDDVNKRLMCAGSRFNEAEVIAEGVENMQVLYGIDDNGDKAVERYVNAADVNGSWSNVISVQIAILVRALRETKSTSESVTYSLLDVAVPSPDDRYKRAVFSTTVNLRNTL